MISQAVIYDFIIFLHPALPNAQLVLVDDLLLAIVKIVALSHFSRFIMDGNNNRGFLFSINDESP